MAMKFAGVTANKPAKSASAMNKVREIILETLSDIACPDTGGHCQVNLQSKGAQEMIADRLEKKLNNHFLMLMEDIACPPDEDRCCGGDCHE